jgi:hypothetical protein
MVDQRVELETVDDTHHILRGYGAGARQFEMFLQRSGARDGFVPNFTDVAMRVKCDVHMWEQGFICVVPHPFYAVTTVNGTFELPLKPGDYTVDVWHEALRVKQGDWRNRMPRKVRLRPGEVKEEVFILE